MKHFFSIFTRNWWLKLLALALALAVFYGVRGTNQGTFDPTAFMKGKVNVEDGR